MQNNHQKQFPAEGSKSSMFDLKTIITILIPALAVLIAGIIGGIDPDKLAALFAIATLLFTAIWGPMKKLKIPIPRFTFNIHRAIPPSRPLSINWPVQFLLTILVFILAILSFQRLRIPPNSDPQFEITALNTLPGDKNTY